MADNIKVVIKVRPLIKREIDDNQQSLWRVSDNTIYPIEQTGKDNSVLFTFDNVFGETTRTQDVYDKVAREIVDAAVDGINGTIFAYGQTSSGKTFTMMGDNESPGVIPLAIRNIFHTIESRVDRDFLLRVSYIEIYNEKIRDLLDVTNSDLKIHEDLNGQTSVKCTEEVTSTAMQVLKLMRKGDLNRSTGETQMNERSSRSHTLFQIIIESRKHVSEMSEEENCANVSQLNLVDLAGSERASQTGATKLRLREGGLINKSLCTLSLVIRQLSEAQGDTNRFISFRDSKLTRILQTSLGGNTKTGIICAVTPASLDETHSTLMFAMRAKAIKNKPKVNEVMSDATQLKRLTKEMAVLQNELQSRKFLEADMLIMKKQMSIMKNQILMGNVVHAPPSKASSQRRKTWAAPRHSSVSSLAPIMEDFPQTDFTIDRKRSDSDIAMLRLSNVTERDDSIISHRDSTSSYSGGVTPGEFKKHSTPSYEIICLDDSNVSEKSPACSPVHICYANPKKPPCVLLRENRHFRKELTELEEITSLEEKDPYEVVELLKQINDLRHSKTLSEDKLQENEARIDTLSKQIETLTEEKRLTEIIKLEIEKKMNIFQCENTDLIFQMDQLKDRTQKREAELLSCLKEARGEDGNSTLRQNSIYQHFLNMSQDISLANNSDGEPSITEIIGNAKNSSIVNNKDNTVHVIDEKEVSDCQLDKCKVTDDDIASEIRNFKLEIEQKNFEIEKLKADILQLMSDKNVNQCLTPTTSAAEEIVEKLPSDNSTLKVKCEEQYQIISNLQHSVDQLNIQFSNLNKDHKGLLMKFADSVECISHLETEIGCLELNIESKCRLIDSLKIEVSSFESAKDKNIDLLIADSEKNNLDDLQINLNQKLSENEELHTAVLSLTCQINDVSKEIIIKNEQIEERERLIKGLTDACDDSKNEITNLKLAAEESNFNKSKEIAELNGKLTILSDDLSNAQSAVQTVDSLLEVNRLQVENENLIGQLSSAENSNRDLLTKTVDSEEVIANKLNEICELKLTIDSLNIEIANLQHKLKANNDSYVEIGRLKSDNTELAEKILVQQEIITNTTKDTFEIKQTVSLLNNTISDLQSDLQQNMFNSQRELDELKSENKNIFEKMTSTSDNNEELLRQIIKHEEIITVKSEELSDLHEKNLSLNSVLSTLQSELENNFDTELEVTRLKNENVDIMEKLTSVNNCNSDLLKKIADYEEVISHKSNSISEMKCSMDLLIKSMSDLEHDIEKHEADLRFERNESVELKLQIEFYKDELQKNQSKVEGLSKEILNSKNVEIHKNILNDLENNKENLQKSRRKSIASPSPTKYKHETKRLSIPKFLSESFVDSLELSDKLLQLDASLKSEMESSEKLKERVSVLENVNTEMRILFKNVQKEISELNRILSKFQNIVFCDCERMVGAKAFTNWFYEFAHEGFCSGIEKYSFEESCVFKANIENNLYSHNKSSEHCNDTSLKNYNYSDILNTIQRSLIEASLKLGVVNVVEFQNKISSTSETEDNDADNVLHLHSMFIQEIEKKIDDVSLQENKLSVENGCLKIEMDEARLAIGELLKESEELQRKISGQRSDQIVSMAEFSLLTSRLTAMQHYHNNLHTFSASTVTHVHRELYALQLLLLDQLSSERDLNDISFQFLSNKYRQSDQSSQITEEFSEKLVNSSCQTDTTVTCDRSIIQTVSPANPNQIQVDNETDDIMDDSSCLKDTTLPCDVHAVSATGTTHDHESVYGQLMENFKSKCDENVNLIEKIAQFEHHMKLYKTLQDDYDSLSTELMESLQEVDSLKEKISTYKLDSDKIAVCSSVQTALSLLNSSEQTSPCKLTSSGGESIPGILEFPMQHEILGNDDMKSVNSECLNKLEILNSPLKINLNIRFLGEELEQLSKMSDCKCSENKEFENRLNALRMTLRDSSTTNQYSSDNFSEIAPIGILNNPFAKSNSDTTQTIFSQVEDNFNAYNTCVKFIEDKLHFESVQYENNSTLIDLFNLCFDSMLSKNQCVVENLQKSLTNAEEAVRSLESEFNLMQSKNLCVVEKMQAEILNFKESHQTLQSEYDSAHSKNHCIIENLQADLSNAQKIAQMLKTELDAVQSKNQCIIEKMQTEILNFKESHQTLQSEYDSAHSKNHCIIENLQADLSNAQEIAQTLKTELDSVQSKNQCVIEKMQTEILNFKESHQTLQSEYESAQFKNNCIIEKLQTDLLNAQENVQTLKTELDAVQSKNQCVIEKMQTDLLNFKESHQTLQSEYDSAQSKNHCIIEKLQSDLLNTEENAQTLKNELDSVKSKNQCIIEKMQTNFLNAELAIQILQSEFDAAQSKNRDVVEKLQADLSNAEKEAQMLKTELVPVSEATASKLLRVVTEKDEEILSFKQNTDKLIDINESLREKGNADTVVIKSLNLELTLNNDKIKELEKQLFHSENDSKCKNNNCSSVLEENIKYKMEIKAMEESITLLKLEIIKKSDVLTDIDKLNCDLEEAEHFKLELIAKNDVMNALLSKMNEENLGLKNKILGQTEKLEALLSELAEVSRTNANEKSNLERDVSEKVSVINGHVLKISELTLQIYNQNQHIISINVQMKCKEEEIYSLLSNKEGLSVLLDEKEHENEDLNRKLREMKCGAHELGRMQTENASLQQKVANCELVNEDLKMQLSISKVYKESYDKLSSELEEMKQLLETKEIKLRELFSINTILETRTDDLQAELNLVVKNSPKARNDLKLKRQSMHDMKRNMSLNNSSNDTHMDVDVDQSPGGDWSFKYQQLEGHSKTLQTRLHEVETEYAKLCERYQECEKHLNERSVTYNKLLSSYRDLEMRLTEFKKSHSVTVTQDATTNTNTDLSGPLMAFFVDKMTHEAVKEKGKLLQKNNEDLICKNKELRVEIRRLQHSLQNNTVHNLLPNNDRTRTEDPNLLEKIKNLETELSTLRKREEMIKELEIKCQDLDIECDMCTKELREREDDCDNLYKEKKLLEAEVENLKYEIDSRKKESPSRETQRKRQSMYDANRSISASSLDSLGNTEDSQATKRMRENNTKLQMNLDVLKKHNKELLTKVQKIESKKPNTQTIGVQSNLDSNTTTSLNMRATSTDLRQHPPILSQQSPGDGVVQKQKLSEYMAENQKQKKLIEKLKSLCHARDARNKYLEDCLAKK